jgi:hypothetical protein
MPPEILSKYISDPLSEEEIMLKFLDANFKWLSLVTFVVSLIIWSTLFYAQTRANAATLCEHQASIKELSQQIDGIQNEISDEFGEVKIRLTRIETKMEDSR